MEKGKEQIQSPFISDNSNNNNNNSNNDSMNDLKCKIQSKKRNRTKLGKEKDQKDQKDQKNAKEALDSSSDLVCTNRLAVEQRVSNIVASQELVIQNNDVYILLTHALDARLRQVINDLSVFLQHRLCSSDPISVDPPHFYDFANLFEFDCSLYYKSCPSSISTRQRKY